MQIKNETKTPQKTTYNARLTLVVLALSFTALSACSTFEQTRQLKASTQDEIRRAQAKAAEMTPIVTARQGAWLAGAKVSIAPPTLPILEKEFVYHPTNAVGLSDVASWVTQVTGLPVDISELIATPTNGGQALQGQAGGGMGGQASGQTVPPISLASPPQSANNQSTRENLWRMNINYAGRLSGLLDVAANKSGGWWRIDDGRIVFYKTLTKTFYIVAPSQKFIGTETTATTSDAGASSGNGTAGNMSSSSGTHNTSVYTFDLWADLDKTAKTVGSGANVVTNPSSGSITVTGTPAQVRNVEQWAKQQNDKFSQQVAITVHMFSVKVKNEDHYSWDPSVVFKSGVLDGTLSGAQIPAVLSGKNAAKLNINIGGNGNFTGSMAAINALSSVGDITETMNQTVLALNAHPVPMQLSNSQGYICSVDSTATANVGTTTSIKQCNLTTGFTALFVPNVVNGKVILEMKITNTTNNGFTRTEPQNGSYVQTVNVDNYKFEQPVSLTPGDALLLTSLQHDLGSSNNNGVFSAFNPLFGGGYSGSAGKTMIAIIVTAKIL